MNPYFGEVNEFLESQKKLAHFTLRKFRTYAEANGVEMEELFQVAMISMWKSYQTFDPSKGTWSTYAVRMMGTNILCHIRNQKKHRQQAYLEWSVYTDEDGHEQTIQDLLPVQDDYSHLYVDEFIEKISGEDREMVTMALSGANQEAIAERFDISQSWASRKLKRFAKRYHAG